MRKPFDRMLQFESFISLRQQEQAPYLREYQRNAVEDLQVSEPRLLGVSTDPHSSCGSPTVPSKNASFLPARAGKACPNAEQGVRFEY